MILRRISLMNFRQFYGTQVIDIASPGPKNVTLIHAENGVGKTTLLNAVLWTFFEETTKRFEQREKIINFEAETEGTTEARVEVEFENAGSTYVAIRELRETRGGYKKIEFNVVKIQTNGTRSSPLPYPDQFVHSVIPRNMAQYFFFDGEQAETFSSETNFKEVGAAIRDILGCLLLETAKGDLGYIAKSYDKELGELEGEDLIRDKEKQIADLDTVIETRSAGIADATTNIDSLTRQLEELTDGLRKAQESAKLQSDRDHKAESLVECEKQVAECENDLIRWIAVKGLAVVSERLTQQTLEFVNAEALRGRIPSPYNEEFVDNLLKAQRCICERTLEPASAEWRAVQGLLKNAANAEAMNRVVRVRSRITALREARDDAPHLLRGYQEKLASLSTRRADLQQSLEDLGRKLEGLPVAELQQREHARKSTERKLEELKLQRVADETRNDGDQRDIARLRAEVDALAIKNEHAQKLVMRRDVALQAARSLDQILSHYEQEARHEIQKEVNEILERVARRDYKLDIGPNFELRLLYANGRPTPKSGGENQLMSLAFIAALVQFAQRRSEDRSNHLFVPATVAPLILDSPFGQLDDKYREGTATFVPEMAPQVVLLVSSSQGKTEVLEALHKRVGAEYVLIAENRGAKGAKHQDFVTVNGRRQATTMFNCSRDMTRIERAGSS
jgi:DNA sulfur modification protein DndD